MEVIEQPADIEDDVDLQAREWKLDLQGSEREYAKYRDLLSFR